MRGPARRNCLLNGRGALRSRPPADKPVRLYTDEDLQRLEFILSLARDLGVNISGMAIILQMRERMEEMQRQIQEFVQYIQEEVLTRASAAADPSKGAIVPVRRPMVAPTMPAGQKRQMLPKNLCAGRPQRRSWIPKA